MSERELHGVIGPRGPSAGDVPGSGPGGGASGSSGTQLDRFGDLLVCRTCGDVKGPVPGLANGACELCDCVPVDERRAAPTWPRFDFNSAFQLCVCCGLEALPSGSRWSVWFCDSCRRRVRKLNDLAGRCVVPIGRHSLMNGVTVSTDRGEAALAASCDQLISFLQSTQGISAWGRGVVRSNLEALYGPGGGDVRLARYLVDADRSGLNKEAAFRNLLRSALTADEVDQWVRLCG
jgi:hypothetical protein